MTYKYAFDKYDNESMARAFNSNSPISLKKAVETARLIRGKKVSRAIDMLERVIDKKMAVPYRKYRAEVAHQRGKGVDTGGFPVNVAKEFLRLLKSAQSNASEKEISSELYIISASVRQGVGRFHNGRNVGRKMKSTNVEVIVGEKTKK
jgi:large subunit ribosomal protein L22